MKGTWRNRFLACLATLVVTNSVMAWVVYKAMEDGVALAYLVDQHAECRAHVDFLGAAARGRLTKDDFGRTPTFMNRDRGGAIKTVVSSAMVNITYDEQGKYLSSRLASSEVSK